jgi:hypothetical protein
MSISKAYTSELKKQTNYTATWFPTVPLELGTIGRLCGYEFIPEGSLARLSPSIPFRPGKPGPVGDFSYHSRGLVDVRLKAAGEAPIPGSMLAQADAGVVLSFHRENAIVFLASGCQVSRIEDQEALKEAILAAYEAGKWPPGRIVVTELVSAGAVTVLISSSRGAAVDFQVRVPGTAPSLGLLNSQGSGTLSLGSGIATSIIAQGQLTPLFRGLAIKRPWFAPEEVASAKAAGRFAVADAVVEFDYADLVSVGE